MAETAAFRKNLVFYTSMANRDYYYNRKITLMIICHVVLLL